LFGSSAFGEDTIESDIDIFIQCAGKSIELSKFQRKIGRKINLFFEEKFNDLSRELRNNIINGKILYGYIKVF